MELHGSRPEVRRQEIRCTDCGHTYLIAEGQLSSRCTKCGNISTHALEPRPAPRASAPVQQEPSFLARFQATPDGLAVQEILSSLQVEWQLWAKLTENFSDPVYHAAYLSQAVATSQVAQASDRYREHGAVMALSREDRWQAEVADLMLSRLDRLALLRMQQSEAGTNIYFKWLMMMSNQPFRTRLFKFCWVVMGMMVAFRLMAPIFFP